MPDDQKVQDAELRSPVHYIEPDPATPSLREGIALCLSGGGYRAMLFHAGALWRLNEAGYLPRLKRISSVSGGSITAGVLGHRWSRLAFDDRGVARAFHDEVINPVRRLAGKTIDEVAVVSGVLLPGTIADRIIRAYDRYLFEGATLQDLPDDAQGEGPRFVINATNVQSGALWRFSRPYMADWRVGMIKSPKLSLAAAVGASSAFPPMLSPVVLHLNPDDFEPRTGTDLTGYEYRDEVYLTDGGVYDNLGLETAWKKYRTILVSDGGGRMKPEPDPKRDWARHTYRILNVIDSQVRSLRKRQVIGSFQDKLREGAYWGIWADIREYGLQDALDCPVERTARLAETATRLKRLDALLQERLINWGYAICDCALRSFHDRSLPKGSFPYRDAGIG